MKHARDIRKLRQQSEMDADERESWSSFDIGT